MDDDRFAILRPCLRRLVRLPKHPRLHAGRLVAGDDGRTEREEGADVRHVCVVRDEETVGVGCFEAGGRVPGVDAYVSIV